ncbi:MAG TPA: CoA transferase [Thermoplasmata archaeon]|nr:CoA transferase [Thermoplasmata archaeon]
MATAEAPPGLVPPFGPLAGIRVLESARFVAGPWAATYLGEFGAEVIHVEGPPFAPPYADATRSLRPLLPGGAPGEEISESWVQYSRNKLSVGLDVRTSDGREVFRDLARRSDIWIESSRPGTYDKLGLSDAEMLRANPRLTIVHVSGNGQTGTPERVSAPSYDLTAQAYSGYLSLQGEPDPAPPMRAGTALNDTVTGLAGATAGLMGYIHAQRTGEGQVVDVAQYEVFFVLLENLALDYFMRGVVRGRFGSAHARLHPYDVHRARDGWVVVAAPTPDAWIRLKEVIGFADPQFDDRDYRLAHREPVDRAIAEFCRERSRDELERIAQEHDVAIARVNDIADIARDPHYRERGMFLEWDDPVAGRVKGAGVAPTFSATPGGVWRGAPWLGQDNERVLGSMLGYSPERITELRSTGVVGERPPRGNAPRPTPFFQREGL